MEWWIQRRCCTCTFGHYRGLPFQGQISVCEVSHHRQFIRNRQVSHGGSTWHGDHCGAYLSASNEKLRFSILYKYGMFTIRPGFPPIDRDLRNWLCNTSDRSIVQKRLHGFLCSLLKITRSQLETIASQEQGNYLPTAPGITYQWYCRCTRVTRRQ